MQSNAIGEPGSEPASPRFRDYISLWLTRLARLRMRHLKSEDSQEVEEFYEAFMTPENVAEGERDERRSLRRRTIAEYLERHVRPDASVLDVGLRVWRAAGGDGPHLIGCTGWITRRRT